MNNRESCKYSSRYLPKRKCKWCSEGRKNCKWSSRGRPWLINTKDQHPNSNKTLTCLLDCFMNIIPATYNFCLRFFLLLKNLMLLPKFYSCAKFIPNYSFITWYTCLQISFLYDLIMHLNGDFELGVWISLMLPILINERTVSTVLFKTWTSTISHFNVIALQVINELKIPSRNLTVQKCLNFYTVLISFLYINFLT